MGGDRFAEEVPPSLDFIIRIQSVFEHVQDDGQLRLPGEAHQDDGCITAFDPEFERVVLPIGQVHDLFG
jgi:hypothetical protein